MIDLYHDFTANTDAHNIRYCFLCLLVRKLKTFPYRSKADSSIFAELEEHPLFFP